MKLDTVLKILKERETKRLREGYRGDAATYGFYRHALMFLQEVAESMQEVAESVKGKKRKKREPTNWNLFAAKYLREKKSIQDAARDWKKLKSK